MSSGDPNASPFSRAMQTEETFYQVYERPEESFRRQRFRVGIQAEQSLQTEDTILNG